MCLEARFYELLRKLDVASNGRPKQVQEQESTYRKLCPDKYFNTPRIQSDAFI